MINFGFERLTQGAYEELLAGCTVIEEDTHGEKVLRTAEGLPLLLRRPLDNRA